jgi:surface antigen
LEHAGDVIVARAEPAASASVREDDQSFGAIRNDEKSRQMACAKDDWNWIWE